MTFFFQGKTTQGGVQMAYSKEDVYAKLKKIALDQLGVEEKEVFSGASFKEKLGADSLDIVEMVMKIEEEFELEIPDGDLDRYGDDMTFGQLVDYVFERLS